MANEADDVISVNNADEKLSDANSNYQINDMKCEFKETGYFYGDAKLQLKLTNATSNKGIEGKAVNIFVDKILLKEYKTNSNGLINLNFNKMPGTYNVVAKLKDSGKTIGDITFTIAGIPSNFELVVSVIFFPFENLTAIFAFAIPLLLLRLTSLKTNFASL